MGAIELSNDGLQTQAAQTAAIAAQVAGSAGSPPTGPAGQAAVAAVATAHASIQATATVLATRLEATAAKLSAAGTGLQSTDQQAAGQLASLSPLIEI